MPLPVTASFAALLALFFIVLSAQTIRVRRAADVSVGSGGNEKLERTARGHANFAEYTPLALILMMIAELNGAPAWLLCAIGTLLLAGRLAHGICFCFMTRAMPLRVAGVVLTVLAITVLAITLLMQSLGLYT